MATEVLEKRFDDLTPRELYALLELRTRVFVVEQTCVFNDMDFHDQAALHLWIGGPSPIAYARVLPPGEKFAEASLGRVVTAPSARRTGAGRAVVAASIAAIERSWPGAAIRISAQAYLERFYASFGFARCSADYLEDGIPHLEMLRAPSAR